MLAIVPSTRIFAEQATMRPTSQYIESISSKQYRHKSTEVDRFPQQIGKESALASAPRAG
jgi:hypothetical protein